MKTKILILVLLVFCSLDYCFSQAVKQDVLIYKHFVGTSLWSIANLFPDPADFYELDYGYRFTSKDAVIVRAITWKYNAPLGIPYGSSYGSLDEKYAGYVRAFGVGLGYQRYIWKSLFSAIYATPFLQDFYDSDNKKTQNGFQLFTQAQIGYRVKLFQNRFYIEPSITCNYWPINTNFPTTFAQKEAKWPNFFLFEPHFNIGVNL